MLDGSCSITVNDCQDCGEQEIGGIVGHVSKRSDEEVLIENCINMAKIEYKGSANSYIGGIVGSTVIPWGPRSPLTIMNCANYGNLSYSESSSKYIAIGGIISEPQGDNIINCLNAGNISVTGSTINLFIGGIVGTTNKTINNINRLTNCANVGTITNNFNSHQIGGIAGFLSNTEVSYCFWSDDDNYNFTGNGDAILNKTISSFNFQTLTLNANIHGNETVTSVLNEKVTGNSSYSNWFSNINSRKVSFTINGRPTPILSTTSKIILEPKAPEKDTKNIYNWYTNIGSVTPLSSYEITKKTQIFTGKQELTQFISMCGARLSIQSLLLHIQMALNQ